MERIILIETSTALCSVALAEDGAIVGYRESSAPKAHASLTAVFIQEMLSERGLGIGDCDAICVSMGPGSYTGLRVGVSTAKGLCFGAKVPLIAVGTLDTLVAQAAGIPGQAGNDGQAGDDGQGLDANDGQGIDANDGQDGDDEGEGYDGSVIAGLTGNLKYIVPMIDARRMEVYTAVWKQDTTDENVPAPTAGFRQVTETTPMIIDENSFADILADGPVLFIGDGAGKCAGVIKHPNAHFCQCHPKASSMLFPALAAYKEKRFEDVAYFEPFYLKEFVATVSKKKLF